MGPAPICCENLSENGLKGDLSNATTFNPPLFSLVVIFKSVAFIRQDLAGGRFLAQLSAEEHLELAGLAIRAEFGEFIDLIHGGGAYFSLQHYLPEAVRYGGIFVEKEWPWE